MMRQSKLPCDGRTPVDKSMANGNPNCSEYSLVSFGYRLIHTRKSATSKRAVHNHQTLDYRLGSTHTTTNSETTHGKTRPCLPSHQKEEPSFVLFIATLKNVQTKGCAHSQSRNSDKKQESKPRVSVVRRIVDEAPLHGTDDVRRAAADGDVACHVTPCFLYPNVSSARLESATLIRACTEDANGCARTQMCANQKGRMYDMSTE